MAFRLKKVKYLKIDRHILLQNENGPCPLLAAANALLLQGTIKLPPESVRNGVASLEDICNVLAERALEMSKGDGDDDTHSFHLNELLTIFPTLQDGLDVNPKFTAGVTGVEYTKNLTAFEMLHIELVHGWLLDPQDVDMVNRIGGRTYNELIEVLIQGKEATTQLEAFPEEIGDLAKEVKALEEQEQDALHQSFELVAAPAPSDPPAIVEEDASPKASTEEVNVSTEPEALVATEEAVETNRRGGTVAEVDVSVETPSSPRTTQEGQDLTTLKKALAEKLELQQKLSQQATTGSLIDNFLQSTSHQLTHYGLMELYNHMKEDALSVFFRNNHFCTATKHEGVLYLLVTDLGYATVPEIMWEKLDDIAGDTEYMTPGFAKSTLQSDLLPPPSTPSPETMLAQRNQQEYDFQVALRLSEERVPPTASQLESEDSKQLEEATKASLMDYNGMVAPTETGGGTGTVVKIPGEEEKIPSPPKSQEEADRLVAMNFQAQFDHPSQDEASLALARQLQQEEYQRQSARAANRQPAASSAEKSQCVIS